MSTLLIILSIIKIILIIILTIVVIILFIVSIVVFIPFRYNVCGQKSTPMNLDVEVSWLFKIIKFKYETKNKAEEFYLKVFGFKVLGSVPKKSRKIHKEENYVSLKKAENTNSTIDTINITMSDTEHPDIDVTPDDENLAPSKTTHIKRISKKQEKERKKEKKNQEKKEKSSSTNANRAFETLKKLVNYPERDFIVSKTLTLLKRLYKGIKPDYFTVFMEIGTGEADTTGQILGAIYFIAGMLGMNIIVHGEFSKPLFEIKAKAAGSIMLIKLIFPIMIYVISRPIWKNIRTYFRKRKVD